MFNKLVTRWLDTMGYAASSQSKAAAQVVYLVSEFVQLLSEEHSEGTVVRAQKAFELHLKDLLMFHPKAIEHACAHRYWDVVAESKGLANHVGKVLDGKAVHDVIPSVLLCALLAPYGFLDAYEKVHGKAKCVEDLQTYWKVPKSGVIPKMLSQGFNKDAFPYNVQSIGVLELSLLWMQKALMWDRQAHIEGLFDYMKEQPRSAERKILIMQCVGENQKKHVQALLERAQLEQSVSANVKEPIIEKSTAVSGFKGALQVLFKAPAQHHDEQQAVSLSAVPSSARRRAL